jgi:hypothetical protein
MGASSACAHRRFRRATARLSREMNPNPSLSRQSDMNREQERSGVWTVPRRGEGGGYERAHPRVDEYHRRRRRDSFFFLFPFHGRQDGFNGTVLRSPRHWQGCVVYHSARRRRRERGRYWGAAEERRRGHTNFYGLALVLCGTIGPGVHQDSCSTGGTGIGLLHSFS